jgi:hypothetical protein
MCEWIYISCNGIISVQDMERATKTFKLLSPFGNIKKETGIRISLF